MASDHQLVRTNIKLKLKSKQQTKANRRKLDTTELKLPDIKTCFTIKRNRYDVLQDYAESENLVERKLPKIEDAYKESGVSWPVVKST